MGDAVAGAGGPARAGNADYNQKSISDAIKIYQFYYYPLEYFKREYKRLYGENTGLPQFIGDKTEYGPHNPAESLSMREEYVTNPKTRYIYFGWNENDPLEPNRIPALKKGLTELYKKFISSGQQLPKVELKIFAALFHILKDIPNFSDSATINEVIVAAKKRIENGGGDKNAQRDAVTQAGYDTEFHNTINRIIALLTTDPRLFNYTHVLENENRTSRDATAGKRNVSFGSCITEACSAGFELIAGACRRRSHGNRNARNGPNTSYAKKRNAWMGGGRPSRKKAHRVKRRKTRSRKAKSQ